MEINVGFVLEEKPSKKEVRARKHSEQNKKRKERFSNGNYGAVKAPIIQRGEPFFCEPPSYLRSRQEVRISRSRNIDKLRARFFRGTEFQCFYTGVVCSSGADGKYDLPWEISRDHLVPYRETTPDRVDLSQFIGACVISSKVVNKTFRACPMSVKLKVRQWLSTTRFRRSAVNESDAENVRWIIVSMLDEFRYKGRYLWSRQQNGLFWYPDVQNLFMARMDKMDREFLSLDEISRNDYVKTFDWRF